MRESWRSDMLVLLGRTSGRQSRSTVRAGGRFSLFLVLLCYVVLLFRFAIPFCRVVIAVWQLCG